LGRDMDRLAKRLKALRGERGWSQAIAAKRAGVTERYFSRLETKRHDPSLSTLAKIARAFGLSVSQLLE
jgi:transcriptional regulator with XRE-family HTH domain